MGMSHDISKWDDAQKRKAFGAPASELLTEEIKDLKEQLKVANEQIKKLQKESK